MKQNLETLRHSAAHVLAQAVKELFPKVKLGIGPSIETGFYYDFDKKQGFSPEDLDKIEKKANEIIKSDLKIEKIEVSKQKAKDMLKNEPYKLELLEDLKGKITFYKQGDFMDLCAGPHLKSTKEIKSFKILKTAGAYWKGDSKNKMLQRIYGTSFYDRKELRKYLFMLEEAKKRDHKKLGEQLDLFSFHEEGPGFPFFHPKGTILYNKLLELVRQENKKRNYEEVITPIMLNSSLWKLSGHWDNFKEDMYFTKVDNKGYAVKPMNCPGGLLIYKKHLHSYKELPIRNAEFGLVHRHELSGVLNGLFRVRAFTQDDAHVFCTEEQLESEIIDMADYAIKLYKSFGFKEIGTFIATKPEKSIGSDEVWEIATKALKNSLKKEKLDYKMKEGEGAFYGPKIEFNIKDALGRNWQCGTIQIDFSMPSRFDATYDSKEGIKKTPVMIHRAILGSLERFLGILVEHYAGKFPLWLSPVQARILTVTDRSNKFAKELEEKLKEEGIRVELDTRNESISKKVREAQLQKIPISIVIGDKEIKNKALAVRSLDGTQKFGIKLPKFIKIMNETIEKKSQNISF